MDNPREKAEELYKKFIQFIPSFTVGRDDADKIAKQGVCACINEILNEFPEGVDGGFEQRRKIFWMQVKKELFWIKN